MTHPIDLADVRVASPCKADWNAMEGDNRVRRCAECKLNVYNLSALTAAEVRDLVQRAEGRLCGRFYRRRDGTMLTADCPVGSWRQLRLAAICVVAFVASVLAGFATLSGVSSPIGGRGAYCGPGWFQKLLSTLRRAPHPGGRTVTGMIVVAREEPGAPAPRR